MDAAQAREFLRSHHRAVLATRHPSGRLQMSPVLVGVDEAGRALVSTRETARKTRNVLAHPQVSLCVMSDEFFGQWVQIDGDAEVVHQPDALELLVDYYRRVSGEHPDWDDYRDAMRRERRVIIRVAITRAGPNAHG